MSTPTDSTFKIRNTLVVNTAMWANSTGIYFGASPTLALNATNFAGTSNNANSLGGAIWNAYVNTSGDFTIGGRLTLSANATFNGYPTFNANVTINSGLFANGGIGTSNTVLASQGGAAYWTTIPASWISGLVDTTNATNITTGQMSVARVSGLATSATTDTTNAANITTGQMGVARVSGLATSATTDTTSATNITSGTLPNARIVSLPTSAISGLATSATTDTTNATNISTGTLAQARLTNVLLTNVVSQSITGGATVAPYSIGIVSSGTTTVDCGKCPLQYLTNNGAFTLAAPATDGSCVLLMTNGTGAGAVANSGFTISASVGDALTTTNGNRFMWYILRINGVSTFNIKALQ